MQLYIRSMELSVSRGRLQNSQSQPENAHFLNNEQEMPTIFLNPIVELFAEPIIK